MKRLLCTGSIFVGLLMGIGALAWDLMRLPAPQLESIIVGMFIALYSAILLFLLWLAASAICSKLNRKGK